jgi:aspartyl-tRNA(Asn)/glutamyl-tRNA(Gln) amidotransferase subunit A
MSGDLADLGVLEAAARLRARELSAVELAEACLARIEERNGGEPTFDGAPDAINAWARLYPERALEAARAADERLAREGEGAPLLCGVPVGVKDLYGVAGLPLTASSRVLEGNVATEDALAWTRLRDAGMVMLGHTHTHEFAAGGTTDQVGNPWDVARSAGGSSGGSGAALAAGMVPAALGTDTAGSLRIPAALAGVSAIKPTHGRVPIDGIVPLSATLDHAGPMARTVADCAAVLTAMAAGGAQATPLMPPPAPLGELPTAPRAGRPLEGLRVALTDRVEALEVEDDVNDGLEAARRAVEELGASVVSLAGAGDPSMDDFSAVMFAEVAEHHARHAELVDRYRISIREFVELGASFSGAAVYIEAQQARDRAVAAWEAWFAEHGVDLLLEPTVPMTAQPRGHGYDSGHLGGEADPLIGFTAAWNFTGFPVAALPAGLGSRTGLPVGVSLVAPRGQEALVTQVAIDLQAGPLPALGIAPA